jgi:hypothetical protein
MSEGVVPSGPSHRASDRDVDANARSQFGMRGGDSVSRSSGAAGFGDPVGSGTHTGLGAALTPGLGTLGAERSNGESGVRSVWASAFVCRCGFFSDPGSESLGERRATSTRSAPLGFGPCAFLRCGLGRVGSAAFSSLSGVVSVGAIRTVWDPRDRRESPFESPLANHPEGPQNRPGGLRMWWSAGSARGR